MRLQLRSGWWLGALGLLMGHLTMGGQEPITGRDGGLVGLLEGKRVLFLGDSITQDGRYVSFVGYYLNRLFPEKQFNIYSLGLGSETVSGLSEEGHAGGAFPRPCLFDRLGGVLAKVKPEVVFACYGMNDAIYMPLDAGRFAAFKGGVRRLMADCREAGVEQIFLVTPPIYDDAGGEGAKGYDEVLGAYGDWELTLAQAGVWVIDLHGQMRAARDGRTEVFSPDKVHPGDDGHLVMAKVILAALGVEVPTQDTTGVLSDPLYKAVDRLRRHRWEGWMRHIGYTREKTVEPQDLGDTEGVANVIQQEIDELRR
jgi:lysophospholipase L1-like esterase